MMKAVIFCALFFIVSAWASNITPETRLLFTNWVRDQSKHYATTAESEARLAIFSQNLQKIDAHNQLAAQGLSTYTMGLTKWADLTADEYRQMVRRSGYQASLLSNSNATIYSAPADVSALPASVDWRTKGVVAGIKDQGQCGSCWSFSATGSMEGAHALSTGTLVSLSEQNLVDCVENGQYTCDTGGVMQDGFQWVIDNGGIDSEAQYPYCACSGNACKFSKAKVVATIKSYQNVQQGSESALQSAAASQPGVSVAIDASHDSFQLYTSGVYNEPQCSQTMLDHGVLVVGYGTSSSKDYWLVKNSWGTSWGMQGYIMMSRNKNNQCGIATDASFPTV